MNSQAQTYIFAKLEGTPMNTQGWNLAGSAKLGRTNAGLFPNSELILTDPINSTSGAAFFQKPVNISECQKWTAEFEYRIFDSPINAAPADGLTFCFLADPPTGFVSGGGLGIPNNAKGLMIAVDTWNNSNCFPVPNLQIRYNNNGSGYNECPIPAQPTLIGANNPLFRGNDYNAMKINYDNGKITVSIKTANGTSTLTGFFNIDFIGYFGFTASTGGSIDRHSVRNFKLYTSKPIVSPPNAGRDQTVCSDQEIEIGTPDPTGKYTYKWTPVTGLSDPKIANPKLKLSNNGNSAQVFKYFVTKDSLTNDTLCAYSDDVQITVLPKGRPSQIADQTLCADERRFINFLGKPNYFYSWQPTTYLSAPNLLNTFVQIPNNDSIPKTYTYLITAKNAQANCTDTFTVRIKVLPKITSKKGITKYQNCTTDSLKIGNLAQANYTYAWSPTNYLSNSRIANPTVFRKLDFAQDSIIQRYIRTATPNNSVCVLRDTFDVIFYPKSFISASEPNKLLCSDEILKIDVDVQKLGFDLKKPLFYTWTPALGLSKNNIPNPIFSLKNESDSTFTTVYELAIKNANGCKTGLYRIKIAVSPKPIFKGNKIYKICVGEKIQIGTETQKNVVYRWNTKLNLSDSTVSKPFLQIFTADSSFSTVYVLTSINENCVKQDSIKIRVLKELQKPNIQGVRSVCPNLNNALYEIEKPQKNAIYQWTISGGTLAGGQGTEKIRVNWANSNTNAKLSVNLIDTSACKTATGEFFVTVEVVLKTQKPKSVLNISDTICLSKSKNIAYKTAKSEGSVYVWKIANGLIISGQGSNEVKVDWTGSLGKIWVSEEVNTLNNRCAGVSDTLKILVVDDPKPKIVGKTEVCEQNTETYKVEGYEKSVFVWKVENGEIVEKKNAEISVKWAKTDNLQIKRAKISVKEITFFGCENQTDSLIQIYPNPNPKILQNDSVICQFSPNNLIYKILGNENSVFIWQIEGGKITENRNNQVKIDWDNLVFPKKLSVVEQTKISCLSPKLNFPLFYDATRLIIKAVSTQESNEKNVSIGFEISQTPNLPQNFVFQKQAGNAWLDLAKIQKNDSLFVDNQLDTDNQNFAYRLQSNLSFATCQAVSLVHQNILLKGTAFEAEKKIELQWNPYLNWEKGVKRYEIWRKLDNENAFSWYQNSNSDRITFENTSGKDGFLHCFRIRAVEQNSKTISWSNDICLIFKHLITIPNVITPNGDGKNDFFVINNLELYPDHELKIFNRLGTQIYVSQNYLQNWQAESQSGGTYFYSLITQRLDALSKQVVNQSFSGWIQVLK